jgi:hypothetical protein
MSNVGDDSCMMVLGKGLAAARPTTGSSFISLGRNARKTPIDSVILQLRDTTLGANRTENTKNTVHSGIFILMHVTVATVTWVLLCHNPVKAISLARLFGLSGVMPQYIQVKILCVIYSPI